MNGIEEDVRWLKNTHVWGIVLGLPVLIWFVGDYRKQRKLARRR